jgi:hypothetical protein
LRHDYLEETHCLLLGSWYILDQFGSLLCVFPHLCEYPSHSTCCGLPMASKTSCVGIDTLIAFGVGLLGDH